MTAATAETARRSSNAPRRIVSLVPSLTEALFALGVGERIVGVTRFCEQPAARVALLPKLGGTKNPDRAAIVALAPDLVVASSEENRQQDVVALEDAGLRVLVTHYATVRTALDGLVELAARTGGDSTRAAAWRDESETIAAQAANASPPVRYFCPIWRRPYMTARHDTYMADLLTIAGGADALPLDGPLHYNALSLDEAMAARPEIILLPDEPYRFVARHRADFAAYADVPAVQHDRIVLCDGKLLTWYGPRTPDALRYFAELFDRARDEREG